MNEAAAEYLHSNKPGCVNGEEESTITSNNDNCVALKLVDDRGKNEDVQLATEPTNMADNVSGYISDEPEFLPESCQHQEQVTISSTSNLSHFSDEVEVELSFGAAGSTMNPHVHEDKLKHDSDLDNSFRAAPLSNHERLILRKQALKMRKRPVLAVGRSNIVTGVAKTIKTHFKKHPLAIVNIKGRAEGTSVQEVIFELEQATGAVLVSREPNKVILYRGWGEGEIPVGNPKKRDVGKGSGSVGDEEKVCPKLIEAIRVECGLSTSRME